MSETPPPIPSTRPLRCARFESHRNGAFTTGRDRAMIEDAQQQALAWVNAHPDLEIVSVDTACGRVLTVVTVWHR